MMVAILGSDELEINENDMYRYIKNVIYPHSLTEVVVTGSDGIAECAADMASRYGLALHHVPSRREAVEMAPSVVIFRYSDESHYDSDYCARKGRPFKEYVVAS